MLRIRGYDLFFADPGKHDYVKCRICGAECNVERGYLCARSFIEAMMDRKIPTDRFTCPRSDEDWHWEAVELARKVDLSPDPQEREESERRLEQLVRDNAK